MIPRVVKSAYYIFFAPLMRLNARRHRLFPKLNGMDRAHLGPGQRNYLQNWINVDANLISSKPDLWSDLRYKLPFRNSTLKAIYSHHVIEHLPNLDYHFSEMYRCLMPGGVIRVGGPNGDSAMKAFLSSNDGWFGDWPVKRKSVGGKFENFIFCKGEHLTILTESFLCELAEEAGFTNIRVVISKESNYKIFHDVFDKEYEPHPDLPRTLLIEAEKPKI